MPDNKELIDQIESAMDKLIDIASSTQRLAAHLGKDDALGPFLERYKEMASQLRDMEKTIHNLGLDRNTPQFARIDAKLNAFEEKSKAFLKTMKN